MTQTQRNELLRAVEVARAGVEYSVQTGATCPCCGQSYARVVSTLPWEDNTRLRYHRCRNRDCVLTTMGINIKSVQVDRDK